MAEPPDCNFAALVHDVARLISRRFAERARSLGLTRAQYAVIASLKRHEGINQAGLAELLEIRSISLGRLLERMETAGWVERREAPDDRRAWQVHLGPRARPLLKEMAICAEATRADALEGLGEKERDLLMIALGRVHANLNGPVGPEAGAEGVDGRRKPPALSDAISAASAPDRDGA